MRSTDDRRESPWSANSNLTPFAQRRASSHHQQSEPSRSDLPRGGSVDSSYGKGRRVWRPEANLLPDAEGIDLRAGMLGSGCGPLGNSIPGGVRHSRLRSESLIGVPAVQWV